MKAIIMICTKKFARHKLAILGSKMVHPHNSGSALRIFWKDLQNECTYCTWKFYSFFFSRKNFILGNLIFLGPFLLFDWAWSKLSRATVTIGSLNSQDMIFFMITTGSLNNQDMIRILKQSRHDFWSKHLCDGYCMNIMWWLCVEVKIQQRVIWFCKASLRICYVNSIWMKRSLNAKNW